ncbi:hypothetical protein [Mycobacterium xenopi]|uniref:Uncharacterized protein n=1 Tax=Mycobacterium xenopi TaxID=1789 RepID=A0AAD1M072_MYCXE|nr:hypothetical protein [Mycobacterium xenopi]EUA51352.1 hypothetical protein I552_2293 [Mycobacterium xenopi 3993]MDA3642122.1 hypothetical protein [Mycobacterium xenopi]MDA3658035.1 hypothetical protein [Mycobacterium xenopi]MDA3664605.1 hypothetical protein [Mycobacterium xenopi]ORX22170.1 hypothetical protein AWC32_00550 [Mycobacterium xenopi]
MKRGRDYKWASMKDMPAEFFLPPATDAALWAQTAKLVAGCVAFILILAVIVTLTQGIVIKV